MLATHHGDYSAERGSERYSAKIFGAISTLSEIRLIRETQHSIIIGNFAISER